MEASSPPTLSRLAREDFLATSDPALQEDGGRGAAQLLDYGELYGLWERQQWLTQELDFARDRADWHERIDPEERFMRMYGLSAFFIGEQRVTDELGPIMRAAPTEDQRIFLSTQIADEARHVRFFDRFYSEVGIYEAGVEAPSKGAEGAEPPRRGSAAAPQGVADRLRQTEEHVNESFKRLFDEMLKQRVDRLAAEPGDLEGLVEAITLYHMVIEGALALTGQHFIIDYNEREGTLPAFVEGFTKVARDEHRHIAFGTRFLTDMAREDARYREAIQRTIAEALPVAEKVLDPPWADDEETWELFGVTKEETHTFAAQCLSRRLKVIGLTA